MTYLARILRSSTMPLALLAAAGTCPVAAQEAEPAVARAPVEAPPPADLPRTFAPSGLIGEFNSNENFAGMQARYGALTGHQAAADAGGPTDGYRDGLNGLALPLKVTLPLGQGEQVYLRAGLAPAWTDAEGGNLTESDNFSLSGQLGLLYRPDPDLVLGLGLVAGRTAIDIRQTGGTTNADFVGVQFDYMQRLSADTGIMARAIWSDGTNATQIPLGTSGRWLTYRQDSDRLYLEATALTNLTAADHAFVPEGVRLRPMFTVLYQTVDLVEATDSRGRLRPASESALGVVRAAIRIDAEEARSWRLAPYLVAGIEHEFTQSVSAVDHDPTGTYVKAGLGMNLGRAGRADLFLTRRDSFDGSYTANQVTVFASLFF